MSVTFKNSQFAKDGIHVTYSDNSVQSLSFANKTLTVDSGLVVNTSKASLNQGLDVNNVVANLNNGLVVSGAKATLNQGLEVSQNATLNSNLEVKGNSLFSKDVKINAANLDVNGTVSVSKLLTASNGATISGGVLLAQMGANVSGGMFNAQGGADVKGGLSVSTGSFTAATGATISGGALLAQMGANVSGAALLATLGATVSGAMFNAENGATVKSGLTVATGDFKALNGATVSNALFSAEKGATVSGGLLTASNGANVSGAFNALSGASISGGLLVAANGANVSGAFNALGGATVNSGLTVNSTATMNNDLLVKANATISNGLVVNGALTKLNAGVTVSGQTMSNSLVVNENATVKGDLKVDGNLTVLGTQTFVNTQNLEIKDNAILVSDGNTTDIVESGVMLQYGDAGSVKYAGMKRIPGTGEFVFFKDSLSQIGNADIGNAKAQAEKDNAQIDFNAKLAATTAAGAASEEADRQYLGAQSATAAALAQIQPYTSYPTYDGKPDVGGEWLIIDFQTPTPLTGFNIGNDHGKNSLGETFFLGSNVKEGPYNYIADTIFQKEISAGGVVSRQGVRTISWPSVTYQFLKIVYKSFEISITNSNQICINGSVDGTLTGIKFRQISMSSGFVGTGAGNNGSIGFTALIDLNGNTVVSEDPQYQGAPNYDSLMPGTVVITYEPGRYSTVSFVNGEVAKLNSYLGTLMNAMIHLTAAYANWLSANQSATTAYNTVLGLEPAKLTAKNNALAAWNAAGVISSAAYTVLQGKISELARLVPNIYATVQADSFNSASDSRLKKDIVELDGALEKLDAIRGVRYNWIAESMGDHQVGVIAQEIQSVYPELVKEGGNGFLSVDYPKLTAVLIQALKELKALVLSK